MKTISRFAVIMIIAGLLPAQSHGQAVESYLEGRITVDPEVDPTEDYGGFEIFVAYRSGDTPNQVDTLGLGETDRSGHFSVTVNAPDVGVYPLFIIRHGQVVGHGQLAVADGDSASMAVELPLGTRLIRIRSPENSAWSAYQNTMAQYNQNVVASFNDENDGADLGTVVMSTGSVLWSIFENFPGSFGGELAYAESMQMMEGWNDSLVVERATHLTGEAFQFVEIARAVRRSTARLEGLDASVSVLEELKTRTDRRDALAALQAEIVQAYIDSLDVDRALEAARNLQETFPDSPWAQWADRTEYDIANLFPGNPAPDFSAVTVDGETLRLEDLAGNYVILEFWDPASSVFQQEFSIRTDLFERFEDYPVRIVAISVGQDVEMNEAFKEGRRFDAIHIYEGEGLTGDLAQLYNIVQTPTRILIDRDLTIVGKYAGQAAIALSEDLAHMIENEDS